MSFTPQHFTRRRALRSLLSSSLVMPGILQQLLSGSEANIIQQSHFPARARRVIFLYMSGGVSHVDTFDPKIRLVEDHNKKIQQGNGIGKFLSRPKWSFKPGGACGTSVSDLFPRVREQMDDIALIRSMFTDHNNHFEAALQAHTGSFSVARPSIGSWVSYGLGSENENLPAFVVLAPQLPYAGGQLWASDLLPGKYQGVRVVPGQEPILDLTPKQKDVSAQEMELGFLKAMNEKHLARHASSPALAARIKSFETAFGMQMEAPEAFDLSKETDATLGLYGLQRGQTKGFGWQCLVARRLAERGVRFVELIDTGAHNNWDSHGDIHDHESLAKNVDQPIAGLLQDLKSRGMLDDTLVVWTSEFGRTPFNDKPNAKGREHHKDVFSSWLAGGGVRGGTVYGESDQHGIKVAANGVHVHDFHATILHLLGFNHEKLTYRQAGRDFRLTDVSGKVVTGLLG